MPKSAQSLLEESMPALIEIVEATIEFLEEDDLDPEELAQFNSYFRLKRMIGMMESE